jgi:hypothetical protein
VEAAGPDPGTPIYTTSVYVVWSAPLNQAYPPHHYRVEAWDGTYHDVGFPPQSAKNVAVFDNLSGMSTTICLTKKDQWYEINVYAYNEDGLPSRAGGPIYITTGCYRLNECGGGGCNTIYPPVNRADVPREFALEQNVPNPFNAGTLVRFSLPEEGEASLEVYNILGQKIATLASGRLPGGDHEIQWNGRDDHGVALSSGLYMLRLASGGHVAHKKMVILK